MTSPRERRSRPERQNGVPHHVLRRASALAAAVLVAAGCTAGSGHPARPGVSPTQRSAARTADLSSPAGAQAHAEALLSTVRVPPPATEVSAPPNRYLAGPASYPGSPYLVQTHRIWTVPWSLEHTVLWYHRIGHAASSPWQMSHSTSHGRLTSVSVTWSGAIGNDVALEFVPLTANETGIRADAQVIWTPPRPASERVPATVTAADVVAYYSPHDVVAERHVGAATARRLATLVNGLHRDTRGPHGCLADFGFRLRITFPTSQGPYVVSEFPACSSVTLTVSGHVQPGLVAGARLLRATLRAAGLSAHYQPTPRG